MLKTNYILLLVFSFIFISCQEDALPKPSGLLRLTYPKHDYDKSLTTPYEFETNKISKVMVNKKYWMKISYPKLKATIDITYRPVTNNIIELLRDSEKLTTKHSTKAETIYFDSFENKTNHVYGKLSHVTGNAASSLQFHLTDSTKHFITGALYFNVEPNYDSIYPAMKYIEKDIIRLMNTTQWRY